MLYKVLYRGGEVKQWETYGLYETKEEADKAVMDIIGDGSGCEALLETYKLVF